MLRQQISILRSKFVVAAKRAAAITFPSQLRQRLGLSSEHRSKYQSAFLTFGPMLGNLCAVLGPTEREVSIPNAFADVTRGNYRSNHAPSGGPRVTLSPEPLDALSHPTKRRFEER